MRYQDTPTFFVNEIPVYNPYHIVVGLLERYFQEQISGDRRYGLNYKPTEVLVPHSIVILIDVPGAGKTATVINAVSKFAGAGYMRVRAVDTEGALVSLQHEVAKKCAEWAEKKMSFARKSLEQELVPLCRVALYRLFELYRKKARTVRLLTGIDRCQLLTAVPLRIRRWDL